MRKKVQRLLLTCALGLALAVGYVSFFLPAEEDDYVGTVMIGVHHLGPDYFVPEFYVNKYGGTGVQREGGGSGEICCIMIPRHWRPGLMVEVRWSVEDWSHTDFSEIQAGNDRSIKKKSLYFAKVPVEKYKEAYSLYVHFFPQGRVRVLTTPYSVVSPSHPVPYGLTDGGASATAGSPISEMFTQAEKKYMDRWRNTWK